MPLSVITHRTPRPVDTAKIIPVSNSLVTIPNPPILREEPCSSEAQNTAEAMTPIESASEA